MAGPPPPTEPPLTAAQPDASAEADAPSSLEEAAREKFGLRLWDRPLLYRETADAATDTDLPFWLVLLLSGAIATLGLALNATAVVIGAMLVAPLLGPLLGLSLALAVGDGRLAVQTGITIVLGAAGVVAVAALLTVALPFREATPEILARTRPTTLDLGIAVFSGLAGAVVTVSRERRLSASIPGVAIAVALIPPLGVAGFGIGTGWQWSLIQGSLLLFGANLGGIVLSGMGAFMLVGMHRDDVLETARQWHRTSRLPGLAGQVARTRLFGRLRVFASPWARVVLVGTFVAAVAVPLTSSLRQVIREARVESAVATTIATLQDDAGASVLARSIDFGEAASRARFRVATQTWIGETQRTRLERDLSAAAGEPVTLVLEQLLAAEGDAPAGAFAPFDDEADFGPPPPASFEQLEGEIMDALASVALPDDVALLGATVLLGGGPAAVRVAYAAPAPLPPEAAAMLARQAAQALRLPPAALGAEFVSTRARALPLARAEADSLAALLRRFPALRLAVDADTTGADARALADALADTLARAGIGTERVERRGGAPPSARLLAPATRPDGL